MSDNPSKVQDGAQHGGVREKPGPTNFLALCPHGMRTLHLGPLNQAGVSSQFLRMDTPLYAQREDQGNYWGFSGEHSRSQAAAGQGWPKCLWYNCKWSLELLLHLLLGLILDALQRQL